jgi:hypothetical protein
MNDPFAAATLRVFFPTTSQWPGWHVPEFSLTSLTPSHDSAQEIIVKVDPESRSDYSSDSPVFRALRLPSSIEGPEGPSIFALKFAMREDLVG